MFCYHLELAKFKTTPVPHLLVQSASLPPCKYQIQDDQVSTLPPKPFSGVMEVETSPVLSFLPHPDTSALIMTNIMKEFQIRGIL